jgi:hypothetical protein
VVETGEGKVGRRLRIIWDGFRFPLPCLRGATLARTNVDWTDVLFSPGDLGYGRGLISSDVSDIKAQVFT